MRVLRRPRLAAARHAGDLHPLAGAVLHHAPHALADGGKVCAVDRNGRGLGHLRHHLLAGFRVNELVDKARHVERSAVGDGRHVTRKLHRRDRHVALPNPEVYGVPGRPAPVGFVEVRRVRNQAGPLIADIQRDPLPKLEHPRVLGPGVYVRLHHQMVVKRVAGHLQRLFDVDPTFVLVAVVFEHAPPNPVARRTVHALISGNHALLKRHQRHQRLPR